MAGGLSFRRLLAAATGCGACRNAPPASARTSTSIQGQDVAPPSRSPFPSRRTPVPRTRVMLVDDHEIVRFGLRSLIDSEPDMQIVGEAIDGASAIHQAEALRPDVIVMDIRMGPLDGVEACREIRARLPEVAVLMFTSFGTDEAVMSALVAGASGFLVKNTGRDDLLRAI